MKRALIEHRRLMLDHALELLIKDKGSPEYVHLREPKCGSPYWNREGRDKSASY